MRGRWRTLARCGNCGVAYGRRCRDDDDELADEPCPGRRTGKPQRREKPKPTRCTNGHRWTKATTRVRPNGARECRCCIRDRNKLATTRARANRRQSSIDELRRAVEKATAVLAAAVETLRVADATKPADP